MVTFEFTAEGVFADADARNLASQVVTALTGGRDVSPFEGARCWRYQGDTFRLTVRDGPEVDRHVADAVDGVFRRNQVTGTWPRRTAS